MRLITNLHDYFRADNYRRLNLILGHTRLLRFLTVGFISILFGVSLLLLKIWPSLPPHVPAKLRISALDWLQSQALARTARGTGEGIPFSQRRHAWRSAIGNHPGDVDLNRDYLSALMTHDRSKKYWADARQTAYWLLQLSQTNVTDVALTARVFDLYELDEYLVAIVESAGATESQDVVVPYLKALFRTERYDAFESRLADAPLEMDSDPTLDLYWTAFQAMGADPALASASRMKLVRVGQQFEWSVIASRLLLKVCHRMEDLAGFEGAFLTLTEAFADRPTDHYQYWDLLTKSERLAEARQAAKAYVGVPRSAEDVMMISDGYLRLGLSDLGLRYLQNYPYGFTSIPQKSSKNLENQGVLAL